MSARSLSSFAGFTALDGIVYRRGGEEKEPLRPPGDEEFTQPPVARRIALALARDAGIPEVVRFINDHDVGIAQGQLQPAEKFRVLPLEVGVIEDAQVFKAAVQVRQSARDLRLPHVLACSLRRKEDDALALVRDHALDHHQADEGLSQAHAVAQKCAAELVRDTDEIFVGVLLVAGEDGKDFRLLPIPCVRREPAPAEEFMQRLEPDLERRARVGVAFQRAEDVGRDVVGILPMALIPFLQEPDL